MPRGHILDGSKLLEFLQNPVQYEAYVCEVFEKIKSDGHGRILWRGFQPSDLRVGELLGVPWAESQKEVRAVVESVLGDWKGREREREREDELDRESFSQIIREILTDIGTALNERPILVDCMDGSDLKQLLNDSQNWEVSVSSLFEKLDVDNSGKLDRRELKGAILSLGFQLTNNSQEAVIDTILVNYGSDEEAVGEAEFGKLLKDIMTELSEVLSSQPVYVASDKKVMNGYQIRKILGNEEKFKEVSEEIFREWDVSCDGKLCKSEVADGFKKLSLSFGLPPPETEEEGEKLYRAIFGTADYDESGYVEKLEFKILLKSLFTSLSTILEARPVVIDSTMASSRKYF